MQLFKSPWLKESPARSPRATSSHEAVYSGRRGRRVPAGRTFCSSELLPGDGLAFRVVADPKREAIVRRR